MTYFNPVNDPDGARWCPFARIPFGHEDAVTALNRKTGEKPAAFAPCLGARCAAWRWASWLAADGRVSTSPGHALPIGQRPEPFDGYCGLAGRPNHQPDQT